MLWGLVNGRIVVKRLSVWSFTARIRLILRFFSIRYLHLSFMSADIARYRHKCNHYVENHTQQRVSLFQPVCKNKAAGKPVYSCVF